MNDDLALELALSLNVWKGESIVDALQRVPYWRACVANQDIRDHPKFTNSFSPGNQGITLSQQYQMMQPLPGFWVNQPSPELHDDGPNPGEIDWFEINREFSA